MRLFLASVVLGSLTIANAQNQCILDDFSTLLADANSDGIINSVAGPCMDREGERSYLTVGQGVFTPFDNDFTGSFCIGFLMDTSSANTAPLAYFHDGSGGILGNLTVLNDSIALNIKGAEVVFTVETVGFKRFQLCREGNEMTLYDGCSAVKPSQPFPEFDPGFDNTSYVGLLRDQTASQSIFQNSVTQFYFLSCTGPDITQVDMAQVQCDSSPQNCTKPVISLEIAVQLYENTTNDPGVFLYSFATISPTATPISPTATPISPTATPISPTATPISPTPIISAGTCECGSIEKEVDALRYGLIAVGTILGIVTLLLIAVTIAVCVLCVQ